MDVRIEYLVDLKNFSYKKADKKTILALIGSEKEPVEAIIFEKKPYGSVVSAEDKTGTQIDMDFIETLSLGKKTNEEIYLSVKEFINDRIKEMSSGTDEEDEGEVFCTNPDCMNFGCVVKEPIKEKDGPLICPECGEELSTEEASTEDLSFDDLHGICHGLLVYWVLSIWTGRHTLSFASMRLLKTVSTICNCTVRLDTILLALTDI